VKITSCTFEISAHGEAQEPRRVIPHVVFLGRSNVGKSTLINRLLGTKGLARTSSRPGRTQSVNYYLVNDSFYFIDLPGYGYAEVPKAIRDSWGPLVEGFLERRQDRIRLAMIVVDARRDPTKTDAVMRDWVETMQMDYLILATKSDKLSGNARARARSRLVTAYGGTGRHEPLMISAETIRISAPWRKAHGGPCLRPVPSRP